MEMAMENIQLEILKTKAIGKSMEITVACMTLYDSVLQKKIFRTCQIGDVHYHGDHWTHCFLKLQI